MPLNARNGAVGDEGQRARPPVNERKTERGREERKEGKKKRRQLPNGGDGWATKKKLERGDADGKRDRPTDTDSRPHGANIEMCNFCNKLAVYGKQGERERERERLIL